MLKIMEKSVFLSKLSKYLFWDYNIDTLNPNNDINMILERVFTKGTECDEKEIFGYYTLNTIKESVTNIKYFDKKTLNYLSVVLNIPKEEFKCYKKSQSETPFGIL